MKRLFGLFNKISEGLRDALVLLLDVPSEIHDDVSALLLWAGLKSASDSQKAEFLSEDSCCIK